MSSSEIDRAFCKVGFQNARAELVTLIGAGPARRLLARNMDVCGNGDYWLNHWVADGEFIQQDLYGSRDGYVKAANIWDAKEQAVRLLIAHIKKARGLEVE